MGKTPFVYIFNTASSYYLYDVNKSRLIKISQRISDLIKSGNYESDDDCKILIEKASCII